MTRETNRATNTEDSDSTSSLLTRRRVLKTGAGATAAAVGLPAASGLTAAHFHGPAKPTLTIDIKPGSDKNPINPNSNGVVPVAVIHTEEFDPTNENVNYRFGAHEVVKDGGGARPSHDGHVTDLNNDGQSDLLLHFPMEDTGFNGDEEEGHLHWERATEGHIMVWVAVIVSPSSVLAGPRRSR